MYTGSLSMNGSMNSHNCGLDAMAVSFSITETGLFNASELLALFLRKEGFRSRTQGKKDSVFGKIFFFLVFLSRIFDLTNTN